MGRLSAFFEESTLWDFHDQYQPGDRVFKYNDLGPLSGSSGYALIRGEAVVAIKIVLMS